MKYLLSIIASCGLTASLIPAQDFKIKKFILNPTHLDFEWNSQSGMVYSLWSSADLTNWGLIAQDIEATAPIGMTSIPLPADDLLFYRIKEHPGPLVRVQTVTVGDAGNAADTSGSSQGNSGAVSYEYQIGKYEVTNREYTDFLNAVDPTGINKLNLYYVLMGASSHGGITNTAGNADGSKYEVKAGYANRPVVYVSYFDAMRFCNWLHNGAQSDGDTENGAYTLLGGGVAPTNGITVVRNPGAKFAVPTENEWYKAAYYQPSGDGGDTNHYWLFPTGGNLEPNASAPPGTSPAANFNGELSSAIAVGAYTNTEGHYGTFDMAGNVAEWLETISAANSSVRVNRGGAYFDRGIALKATNPNAASPSSELHYRGFRISKP
ncbi:MAG: SUMF1/EgtB/PvdO family nonheme iron enzyme [Akkermansiaceae bacterium]